MIADEKFRSRKFLIVAGTLLFSSFALLIGQLEGAHYAAIVTVCVGAYSLANAFEGRNSVD